MIDGGAVGRLKALYRECAEDRHGSRIGERVYRMTGTPPRVRRLHGLHTLQVSPRSKVIQIFVGFESGSAC